MNARYYDPNTNRFLTLDSIVPDPTNPQSFNRYSYVRNNPINFTDPTGHRECGGPYDPSCNGEPFPENRSKNSPKGQNPIRHSIEDTFLGELPIRGLEIILLPPGFGPPEARDSAASQRFGRAGMWLDVGEAAASILQQPLLANGIAIGDAIVTFRGSYLSGETGRSQLHPDLPEMYLIGQDVVWTASEAAIPPIVELLGGVIGTASCGPVCGIAGIEAGILTDVVTSGVSTAYDLSRNEGMIPTFFAIGYYSEAAPSDRFPLPTLALVVYSQEN